jgi:hypothetical protein
MTFENGTVQCILDQGFYLEASPKGVPSLTLKNTTIQNTGLGVYASAGTAAISGSTIRYNGGGVQQDTDGTNIATIDLSGGAEGGVNTVACSNSIEGTPWGYATGISVLNTTSHPLNASNVSWDTSGPDVFGCDAQLSDCTCEIASCATAPGADGMDAVYEAAGTITTTGNQLSTLDCTLGDFNCCTWAGVPIRFYCAPNAVFTAYVELDGGACEPSQYCCAGECVASFCPASG